MKTGALVGVPVLVALAGLSTAVTAQVDERAVLAALYDSTGGDNWTNSTNWKDDSRDIGDWFGVGVNRNGRVVSIELPSNGLAGTIPPELGRLAELRLLNLQFNGLTGSIPGQLGDLARLESLGLSGNGLTGTIPPSLGELSSLLVLSLSLNSLTGSIPPELGALANLLSLDLAFNDLTGTIPRSLGELADLVGLLLAYNDLTGSIPADLGSLSDLHSLDLGDNDLTGGIPAELGDLPNLALLALGSNRLTGSIPAELGALANLQQLYLEDNDLSGEVPAAFSQLASLTVFLARGTNRVCLPASLLEWHAALSGATDAIPTCGATLNTLRLTVEPGIVVRGRTVTFRALTDADANRYTWTVSGEVVNNDSPALQWSFEHPGWKTISATAAFVDEEGMPVTDAVTASLGVEVLSEEDSRANVCTSEDPFELCLGEGRFAATVDFFDPRGRGWTAARTKAFSRDTGFFTFFDETNVEVMVKVLDACGVNGHYWVFAGGATDLGIRLTVLDKATGLSAPYETVAGRPFRAITNLRAFSCSEGTGRSHAATVGTSLRSPATPSTPASLEVSPSVILAGERVTSFRVESDGRPYMWVIPVGHPDAGACRIPDSSKLCLHDGRFSATAEYRDPGTGEWKPAAANSLTRETGYYTFLQPGNVEIFVKVLDACETSGRYWVYMGGATDLAVRVRVEHQPEAEGEVRARDYETTRGPFVAVRDNRAFACSP